MQRKPKPAPEAEAEAAPAIHVVKPSKKPRRTLTRMQFMQVVTQITKDQDQIKYDLAEDRATVHELGDKYGLNTKVMGDVLAQLGIRPRPPRSSAAMVVDLRKLERVTRKICTDLGLDYDAI